MPRTARRTSDTGVYHVMLRGINRQLIFHDDEDYSVFTKTLIDTKVIGGFELFGYCHMGNHTHILLKVQNEDLSLIFKRIGSRFVYWYNRKYERSGHLFQDRFKSETIENDNYLLAALRYIHQNPVRANICKEVGEYKWSSYNDYIRGSKDIDTSLVLGMMSIDQFIEFCETPNQEHFLDETIGALYITDASVKELMKKVCGGDTVEAFQKCNAMHRSAYIRYFKDHGASIRQISRLTGVSKGIVERS